MSEWKLWTKERPKDFSKLYRFRVSWQNVLGLELRPEWTDRLIPDPSYDRKPPYYPSTFNYRASLCKRTDIEWREAIPDEPEGHGGVFWNGLDLLPCPFTGKIPVVEYSTRHWTAPPFEAEKIWLKTDYFKITANDARELRDIWNTRKC